MKHLGNTFKILEIVVLLKITASEVINCAIEYSFAEESDDVYRLSTVQFARVTGADKHVCGNPIQPYSLCVECHDRYVSQGRQPQPRKGDTSDLNQKNVAFARLLALAPDLMSRAEPLHEIGIDHHC